MLAAAKELPTSVYGIEKADAEKLYMVKSFLDDQDIPRCYLNLTDTLFKFVTRSLWQSAPVHIRTSNKATIGDLFENSIPSAILPNFSITLRCLGDDSKQMDTTFNFQEALGPMCRRSDPSLSTYYVKQAMPD